MNNTRVIFLTITNVFLFLTFLLTLNAKSQVTNQFFNTTILTELNEPLIAAIDRHIEVSKAKRIKNKNDYFIQISIFPSIRERSIPKDIFDSIYSKNDFQTVFPNDSVTPSYSITIVLVSKNYYTEGWIMADRKNNYYYNHKDYEILISSELNIKFNNEGIAKQIDIPSNKEPKRKKYKFYKIWTGYSMWNRYITEIRMKDLIWPTWTGKSDDFK